jgi:hypothetical protein
MIKSLLLSLVLVSFYAGIAQAAGCYTPLEAESEQGIRIHSELMVISLNCAHMATANGKNLYAEHRKFTAKYADLFATYEKILIQNMAKSGVANPEKALHEMRTNFANKISKDSAEMRPDKFCRTFAPRVEKITAMEEIAFRKWAATPFPSYPVSKPYCTP